MFLSNRIYIAVIFSLFLHLSLMVFVNQNSKIQYLKTDLFNGKISVNFSNFLAESAKINIQDKLKKTILVEKQNKSEILTAKMPKISDNIVENTTIIPSVSNFELQGQKIIPQYPKRALRFGWEGIVYLKILVSDDGLPEQIIFSKKSQYDLLNKAAFEAVSRWRFKTTMINGSKSKMWIEVPIEFKIS